MAAKRPMYALCAWSPRQERWMVAFSSADLGKVELSGGHFSRLGLSTRIEAWSSSVDDFEGVRVFPLRRLS